MPTALDSAWKLGTSLNVRLTELFMSSAQPVLLVQK